MDAGRKEFIRKQIIAQMEDQIEAMSFESKICVMVGDDKGLETIKTKVSELQKKIEAGNKIMTEETKGV